MENNKKTYGSIKTAGALMALAILCVVLLGFIFKSALAEEPIVSGPGVTEVKRLSEYFPDIANTAGDTDVYVMKGKTEGPSMLVLGGTHANEPSGYLTAVMLVENAIPESGTLYVIPRTNNSGFTTTDPQEGAPMTFDIETPAGSRTFRFGSRATNPIHQWPDPEIYIHDKSGDMLSGGETRNINRTYPGRADGSFTEKVSYAITTMIQQEQITMTVDLHEAAPEYPTNNALVFHEDAMLLAASAVVNMAMEGMEITPEASPPNLHGLTHRELGDYTDTLAMLMETPNASQGRLRGKTDARLVVEGTNKFYLQAEALGQLYVPWDENGHPLVERVARHLTGIMQIALAYNMDPTYTEGQLVIGNIPTYSELMTNGLGVYLNPEKEVVSAPVAETQAPATTAPATLPPTAAATQPQAAGVNSLYPGIDFTVSDLPAPNPIEETKLDAWKGNGVFTPEERVTAELSTYKICEGLPVENEVTVLKGAEPGPSIYIVASVHGDEVAAYAAANNLKNMEIKRGTLYILSPANKLGAENRRRFVSGEDDLNRLFPGDASGSDAEKLADAIFNDIKDKQPDIVMDLHEAVRNEENRDFLGSSIIYTDLAGMEDMFMDMLFATQAGELCSEPFNFFGPGPLGSLNNVVTTELKVPTITVETYRGYPLERRVVDQLSLLGYVLRHYGLID